MDLYDFPSGINGINSSSSSGIGMITVLVAGAYMDRRIVFRADRWEWRSQRIDG